MCLLSRTLRHSTHHLIGSVAIPSSWLVSGSLLRTGRQFRRQSIRSIRAATRTMLKLLFVVRTRRPSTLSVYPDRGMPVFYSRLPGCRRAADKLSHHGHPLRVPSHPLPQTLSYRVVTSSHSVTILSSHRIVITTTMSNGSRRLAGRLMALASLSAP